MERRLEPRGRSHTSQGRARLHAPQRSRPLSAPPAPPTGPPPAAGRAVKSRTPGLLIAVRYVLPSLIVVAGLVALSFGTLDSLYGGVSLIGAGLSVALINWVYRIGVRGDDERAAEDHARRYFDRFGRWPDETR